MKKFVVSAVALTVALAASQLQAGVLTNGSLSVTINDNGSIDSVLFGGSEFYKEGTFVSDFGAQIGTDTSSFLRNGPTSNDFASSSFTDGAGFQSWTGTGSGLEMTRDYSLVAGQNVLQVTTTVSNISGGDLTDIRTFDSADPDQGVDQGNGFATLNDVVSMAAGDILKASELGGLTTVWGYTPTTGGFFGGFLGIDSGAELNGFFAGGATDPNGALSDIGMGLAAEFSLADGESFSYTYFQAFGTTADEAMGAFNASVPEPTSMAIFGFGVLGLVSVRRRKA